MLCLWKLCFLLQRGGGDGIQPERLNAEGDSPSALSRGLSVSATPGAVSPLEKRLKDANVAAKEADFRVFQTHHGRCYDTEGYASLRPRLRASRSAWAFDLSGRAAVKLVIVSLSKAVHPDLWGLGNQKNRLDHRENDSRAIFSFVSQLLSDSNISKYHLKKSPS